MMLERRLGRTEHRSSVAVLGGAAFAVCTPDEAERGFHEALARGVNHLDIAPRYGAAEDLIGPHVPAVRDRLSGGRKATGTDSRRRGTNRTAIRTTSPAESRSLCRSPACTRSARRAT